MTSKWLERALAGQQGGPVTGGSTVFERVGVESCSVSFDSSNRPSDSAVCGAPLAPKAPIASCATPIEANGAIGAEWQINIEERAAMAEMEGGVPPVFSLAFAAFQMGCPASSSVAGWQRAVDDAGCFLDHNGHKAATLGWLATDLFAADGLAWALEGAAVVKITAAAATLSDGRVFRRCDGRSSV